MVLDKCVEKVRGGTDETLTLEEVIEADKKAREFSRFLSEKA